MACYWPVEAYQARPGAVLQFKGITDSNVVIPCGRCIGCRTDRANMWAHRCTHEATQWRENVFVTLTYDEEHLPESGYLDADALQRFLKRLRRAATLPGAALTADRSGRLRYFACGEYGEKNGRPHYHAILFNARFPDATGAGSRRGRPQFTSEQLNDIWGKGRVTFGAFSTGAANYIAQYTLKKQGYGRQDDCDADGVWRPAPFLRMSLKPGIGNSWLQKHKTDLRDGFLRNSGGGKAQIPRAYLKRLERHDPELYEDIKTRIQKRGIQSVRAYGEDQRRTEPRLRAAELIHKQRKQLTERREL